MQIFHKLWGSSKAIIVRLLLCLQQVRGTNAWPCTHVHKIAFSCIHASELQPMYCLVPVQTSSDICICHKVASDACCHRHGYMTQTISSARPRDGKLLCLLECDCQTSVPDADLLRLNLIRSTMKCRTQFRTGQSGSEQATMAHNELLL